MTMLEIIDSDPRIVFLSRLS